jgi:hypothetical protein
VIPGTAWCGASRSHSSALTLAGLFAHNHGYNGLLQTRDAGCITGGGSSGGTLNGVPGQIVYNVLHDCYDLWGLEISQLGIGYLDLGTCDLDIHHNLLWAAPGSLQRGFYYNTACANIRERDNVLWKEFSRNAAELQPEDFPGRIPFRFGHDFQNPPPRPPWPQLETVQMEAEKSTAFSSGAARTPSGVTGLKDGDWITFDKVDFQRGWQSAVLRFASDVQEMNTDKSAQNPPRHQKTTDPLVLACSASGSALAKRTGYDDASPKIGQYWTRVFNLPNGAWLRFNQVPLGEGYRRFRAVYGYIGTSPARLEVRLDRVDGPLAVQVPLPRTPKPENGPMIYGEAVVALAPAVTGTHDVFLVFQSEEKAPLGKVEFEYFRFEQYRGQIPLQKNEVKIEIRAGGKDGEKLGEFYPRFTGGADVFRELVATLEPTKLTGPQTLYFVVRSATGKPIGTIDWLSLEKAKQPMDLTGLGVEPQKRDGQFIFPEPTHRPLPPDIRRLPSRLRQKLASQKN